MGEWAENETDIAKDVCEIVDHFVNFESDSVDWMRDLMVGLAAGKEGLETFVYSGEFFT